MRNLNVVKPLILSLALAGPFAMPAHAGEDDDIDTRLARGEQHVEQLGERIQSIQVRGRDASADTEELTPSERWWQFWDKQAAKG